ncbi:hypothetical protein [Ammoniphilus sp. YIM 78166]|uniref:hypothetical protein n=1 Tax=Ammoniphilus sp. YIM 78166 TaxID=1644106 RepID=UPI001070156F|nr:hypothetical protein [Ammoniphilus sp. YIM 78166]
MTKLCFAVLVHEKKEVVREMLANIRHFCPSSHIVLYNGGHDESLCEGLSYPVCPASHKLSYGKTTIYMLQVMKWLHQMRLDYDYLINLDSDALFARKGFEDFIAEEMGHADYMGVRVRVPEKEWYPGISIKREWAKWRPLFGTDPFLGCFNVGQIYSKRLVQRIIHFEQIQQVERNLAQTTAFGTDETVYVNLVKSLGFKPKRYPDDVSCSIRFRPHFTEAELKRFLANCPRTFLFHPISREWSNPARSYIRSLVTGKREDHPVAENISRKAPHPVKTGEGLKRGVKVIQISNRL